MIALACYDTEENGRTEFTQQTIECLHETVDFNQHRLFIIDNGSCEETKHYLHSLRDDITIITNPENLGTAKAINQAWKHRKPGEHLIKMDNDVDIRFVDWVDQLEEAIERDPSIGIIGLKRKDLLESPFRTDDYRSQLRMLPHQPGEKWIIVEDVEHVMGTCQMYNYRLIDKIGGMYQMDGLYGFDDVLAAIRCKIAGFKSCFLSHIEIDHIDPGGTEYTEWKRKYAGEMMERFNQVKVGMFNGTHPIKFDL